MPYVEGAQKRVPKEGNTKLETQESNFGLQESRQVDTFTEKVVEFEMDEKVIRLEFLTLVERVTTFSRPLYERYYH